MVKTKKKEVQKPGLRPSQKAKAEKLRQKQEAKVASASPSLQENIVDKTEQDVVIEQSSNKSQTIEPVATITVKNADGDPDTEAQILIQNKIDYTPKVSVVMPVYNVEPYLRQCLDSVISQTLREIEIICVDDGSTDASLDILKEYAAKDNRITVITQKNLYAGVARNAGLSQAKGEYLSFLDSDDWVEEDTLLKMYNLAHKEELEVVKCKAKLFNQQLQKEEYDPYFDLEYFRNNNLFGKILNFENEEALVKLPDSPWSGIYLRSFLINSNIRFDNLICANDTSFFYRCIVHAKKCYAYDGYFINYRVSMSSSLMGIRYKNFECQLELFNRTKKLVSKSNNKYGKTLLLRSLIGISSRLADFVHKDIGDEYKTHIFNISKAFFAEINTDEISNYTTVLYNYDELSNVVKLVGISDNYAEFTELYDNGYITIEGRKNSEQPQISIIIPVYNVENNLAQCLDSLINQTFKDIEIICVDDGSKDSSLEVLKKYAKQDNRIIVLKQPNQRQGVARNNGIKYSIGKFIFFCDSDDWLELDCLEKLYNRITTDNTDLCLYGMKTYDNQSGMFSLDDYRDMSAYKDVIGKIGTYRDIKNALFSHFYPFDKLYRRELITDNNILFKSKIFFEDVIFSVKSVVLAKSISFIDENLYLYRDNQSSSTMGSAKNIDRSGDVFCFLQDVYDFLVAENKYLELEKEYLLFAFQQICYHINRVNDANIKYTFVRRAEIFIARNKLKFKQDELQKIYQTANLSQDKNKVLVIEINDCHGECLPGYIKYLKDLQCEVDVLINEKQRAEQPLFMFDNISILYMSEEDIINFLNSNAIDRYKICLFNSNVVYSQKSKSIFELFNSSCIRTKFLCIEHRLENIPQLSQKAVCIVLKKFKKTRLAYEVNPHYFGNNVPHNRNRVINFIVVGNIEGRRKNYGILTAAVEELNRLQINNFKITVVGRGSVANMPEDIRHYFDIKGRLSYPDMYAEMQNADYFLPLLDPTSIEHDRYIKTGTSGSFQLIYGFNIPCIIAEKFARKHGFNEQNSIVYVDNSELAKAMMTAIEQTEADYEELRHKLSSYSENLYRESLENMKLAMEAKVSKKYIYLSYLLFPYYLIRTKLFRATLLRHHADMIRGQLSGFRVDIRNTGNSSNNVNIEGQDVIISNITWNTKQGQGKYIQGSSLSNKLKVKVINDGVLKLDFLGQDKRFEDNRFPVWIDYKSIKINGNEILSSPVATWHDKPYCYEMPVRDGQEVKLEVEQQYHEYTEKELKDLFTKLNYDNKDIINNIDAIINKIKKNVPIIDEKTRKERDLEQYITDVTDMLTFYRIDIRNTGSESNNIFVDADNVTVKNITWNTKQGQGKYIQSSELSNTINIKVANDGILKLEFKGQNQIFDEKRFPVWIDYKSIKIDGREILSAPVATWHDKPYYYEIPVKDGQEITLEIEQQYHEYTENELKDVLPKLASDNKCIVDNINIIIEKLKRYLPVIDEKTKRKRDKEKYISNIISDLTVYRLDVINFGDASNNIDIIGNNISIKNITWNKEQGGGKYIQGNDLSNLIKIKAINDGVLKFEFKGPNIQYQNKRIPVWIDYKSIKIDGNEVLSEPFSTWHDNPYKYEMPIKNGQEVTIEIEQQYHLYSLKEFSEIFLITNKDRLYTKEIYTTYMNTAISQIEDKGKSNDYNTKIYLANYTWKIKGIDILNDIHTIEKIKNEKLSISRYGDGEINLMLNSWDIGFQKYNLQLAERLKEVLKSQNEKHLVCIAGTYVRNNISEFWKKVVYNTKLELTPYLSENYTYGEATITRHPGFFKLIKEIWKDKDIVIVEGELSRMGVGNDLFDNVKSIQRILCPAENAFDKYNEILAACKTQSKNKLFIIALGPTATVLAYDLAKLGYWALDIGHIDIVYEWHLRGGEEKIAIPGKYVNESKDGKTNIADCTDPDYLNSIIMKINDMPQIINREKQKKKDELDNFVSKTINDLSSYRVDIRNIGGETADISVLGENIFIRDITWDIKQGKGKIIEGNNINDKIKLKIIHSGKLHIEFKGPDKKYKDIRFPVCIDYKSIKIDGEEILSAPIATWHDKPYKYEMPVKDGQEITLEVEQQYHEYSENELKDLLLKLNLNSEYIRDNVELIVSELKNEFPIIDEETQKIKTITNNILENLSSFRLDIKNLGAETNDLKVVASNMSVSEPKWAVDATGRGKLIQGHALKNTIELEAINDGNLRIYFRGQDKRFDEKRFPVWIDYKSIKIDGKEILSAPIATWHDQSYRYEMPVKDEQEVTLEIEQQYHQYTEKELKELLLKLYSDDEFAKDNIDEIIKEVSQTRGKSYSANMINVYPLIYADCFIPIGAACRPAYWLRKHNLRYCSLPFDWMMSFSLLTVLSTIKSGVSSWFNEYVEDESKIGKKARYVTDTKNKIISMHAFPLEKTVDEYMPEFKELFARRYKRMKNILETSKSICFICNRNDDVYNFQLFLQEIAKMNPELQIKLLNIRHSDLEQEIIKYEINPNVIFYDIKANDIHKNGSDKSNPSFWIGNEDLWNEVCSHLSLSDSVKTKLEEENGNKDSAA